ncbi:hypothetical protein E6C76_20260 [Pseudothauera nasutitermitis]|uniref:Uncharacterized protein n=1 Tax=Pseudothauera nasutitermitis TaxID=2565930 RepID=A0A4S4AQG7_9RHOO|nr:hypothetical protein [Pseudothauera nasutitermitis]THF61417.1 hypothetical protein E6C76_20260 [Pseudothauera nasutitermitis]
MTKPREDGALSHSERLKIEYAPVVRALYVCMQRFCTPGIESGVAEVAELIGRNEGTLRNQFGPSKYDHAPTVHAFLQVIEALGPGARPAVAEIADLAECVTIPRSPRAAQVGAPPGVGEAFFAFPPAVERSLHATIARLQAGKTLSVAERTEARDALFDLVAYAAYLITRVR